MHPILAPMIERNAFIGGCDGVAVVKSGKLIGEGPMGTMPHSLILCMGSTVDAIKAYDEVLNPAFKRVALIDTFLDEKFETLNVAQAMGEKLYAVRFDTPGSRLAAVGATLFMASDAVLALNRFRRPLRGAQAVIMLTYVAAQALIALSVGTN